MIFLDRESKRRKVEMKWRNFQLQNKLKVIRTLSITRKENIIGIALF
jgi:hypothetical protein